MPSMRLDERLRRSSLRRPAAEGAFVAASPATGSLASLRPATADSTNDTGAASAAGEAAVDVGEAEAPAGREFEPLAPRTAPAVCWAPALCVGLEFGGV